MRAPFVCLSLKMSSASSYAIAAWFCLPIVLLGCNFDTGEPAESESAVVESIEAEVLRLEPRRWPVIVRSQGNLVADEVAVIGTKVAGRVAEVHTDLGDFVRAGDPLVTLDQQDFRLKVEQAEAQIEQARSAVGLTPGKPIEELVPENAPPVQEAQATWDEAKANLERAKQLRSRKTITQAEFDLILSTEQVAAARYASAVNAVYEKIALIHVRQAELSLAREELEESVIRAPFDGFVQQRQVAPGTYVSVGDSIVTLVRTNPLRYRGTMPERYAQSLSVGQDVLLRVESVDERLRVQVTRISPVLDPRSRSLLFEAKVENSDQRMRTGLFAEAEVTLDAESMALVVPHSALMEFAGTEKVWQVDDGMAREQEVLTGQRRQEGIEILEGLQSGGLILRDADQGRVAKVVPLTSPSGEDAAGHPEQLAGGRGNAGRSAESSESGSE